MASPVQTVRRSNDEVAVLRSKGRNRWTGWEEGLPVPAGEDLQGEVGQDTLAGGTRSRYTLTPEDYAAVASTAARLETTPERLLAVIHYETMGTMNPDIVGGEDNQHQGLIQFGPTERAAYGFTPGMGFAAQMEGPVYNYLNGRGLPANASISTIYRTVNGGNPNAPLGRSDENGTLAYHIGQINARSLPRAQQMLKGAGVQVASGAPDAATVPLPRVSPTQTAMAQTAPPATAPVADEAPPMDTMRFAAADPAPAAPAAIAAKAQAAGTPPIDFGIADPEPTGLTVRVQKGDTIGKFARQYPGDKSNPGWLEARVNEIAAASGVKNPNLIFPGQILTVPGTLGPPTPSARPGAEAPPRQVRPGPEPVPEAVAPAPAVEQPEPPAPAPVTRSVAPPPPVEQTFDVDALTEIDDEGTYINQPGQPLAPGAPMQATNVLPTQPVQNLPPKPVVAPVPYEPKFYPHLTANQKQFDDRFTKDDNLQVMPETPLVPGVWDRVTGAIGDLFADAPASAAPSPAVDLDPVVPLAPTPTKDQSRITPDMPSQQGPTYRVAPPRDAVSGTEKPATSAQDFLPLSPSVFKSGQNPAGVENVRLTTGAGTGVVTYDQSGYRVSSTGSTAFRSPLPSTSSTTTGPTVMEQWVPATNSWVPAKPVSGTPVSSTTQLTPVQQSNAQGQNWSTSYG